MRGISPDASRHAPGIGLNIPPGVGGGDGGGGGGTAQYAQPTRSNTSCELAIAPAHIRSATIGARGAGLGQPGPENPSGYLSWKQSPKKIRSSTACGLDHEQMAPPSSLSDGYGEGIALAPTAG